MSMSQSRRLEVPGASLSCTVRGSGPLLLLIAGGEGGAEGYQGIAEPLSDRYTVVTYDRRGAPGSPPDEPSAAVSLETHAEDARRLLAALTAEPAYVFGSSGGALVGLDLAIRHPGSVRMLVAHEPPVEGVLADFDRVQDQVAEALRQGGVPAAMAVFFAQLGLRYDDLEPGAVLPPRSPQEALLRGQALMRYTFPAVRSYRLDLAALAAAPVPVILAAGSAGRDTPVHRCTRTLAACLKTEVAEFPSHHAGYLTHPRAFAARLEEVLRRETEAP